MLSSIRALVSRRGSNADNQVDTVPAPDEVNEDGIALADIQRVEIPVDDYDDSDDDSNETVVEEDYARRMLGSDSNTGLLSELDDETHERRRREAIRTELERVQRSNFLHFMVLLLVPTCLLMVIFINVLTEDDDCDDGEEWTICAKEPRSFINAFTSRCICDAVKPELYQNGEL
jgi:hypothetical protein